MIDITRVRARERRIARRPFLVQLLQRIERFRTRDGGYEGELDSPHGSAYGCFLALGAYQEGMEAIGDQPGSDKSFWRDAAAIYGNSVHQSAEMSPPRTKR